MHIGYKDILDLPDEVYHLYAEKAFHILTKQIGMGATGYDFSSEEEKRIKEFLFEDNK